MPASWTRPCWTAASAMKKARSIVFIDRPDWHARQLAAAFAKAGVEAVLLSLRHCGFIGTAGRGGARPPPFPADDSPPGALVASVSAGRLRKGPRPRGGSRAARGSRRLL